MIRQQATGQRLRPWRRSVRVVTVLGCACAVAPVALASSEPRVAEDQLLLIREALQVVETVGDDLWPGWSDAPKTTLLIDDSGEFLINLADEAPTGFARLEQTFRGLPIHHRDRRLPSTLRAAFTFGDTPVAAVGAWQPEVESPNEWVVTLVEQWFHVLRISRGEQDKVRDLHLTRLETPVWQIDYPFPFDDPDVGNAMLLLGQALYDFWSGGAQLPREGQRTFLAETAWAALQNLEAVVTLKHGDETYRYFQLQVWREGVARYSGVLVARAIARAELLDDYEHTDGFEQMAEWQPYAQMWEENLSSRFWTIRTSGRFGERDRTSFPALGHGIAELLDAVNPDWKERYFEPGIWLDDLVAERLQRARHTVRR